jgi:predicted dehydrogenase
MSAKFFHIPLILSTPSMILHSIVQRTPTPTNSASKDHPQAQIYNSTDAMFADASIDLIVITTTPDSHFALCKSALEAKKHVLVEKPFVPSVKEAEALIEISKESERLKPALGHGFLDLPPSPIPEHARADRRIRDAF